MDSIQKYRELRGKTVPGLLLERVKRTPQNVAYRAKKLGIYKERTWSDLGRMVSHGAMGLRTLGLRRGERLAVMGDPSEEYLICELAAQVLGAVPYGIYPSSSQKELRYLMEDGGASIFLAENQEYVDRILPLLGELKEMRQVLVIDTKGTFMYDHSALVSFEKLVKEGKKEIDGKPEIFEKWVRDIRPSDSAFIAYTAGTTGFPKGVLVSQGKHLAAAYTFIDRYPVLDGVPHRTIVHLPLAHLLGRMTAITLPLLTDMVPHYGEGIEDLGQTFFETAPTVLLTVPRYLQKFSSSVTASLETTTPIKKFLYHQAITVGRSRLEGLWRGQKRPFTEFLYFLAYWAVFRPILNKIGFNRVKIALSSDAPLGPEIMALWQTYGLNLSQVYAQAETGGGVISAQEPYFPRPGHVGKPPRGWEVTLSQEAEILVKGLDLFEGYWGRHDLTERGDEQNGWLHTGDLGEWTPEGHLRVIERAGDIIRTSSGKVISPVAVENLLKSSAYISE
ncbi:MAG: AMP-binding protein, partial [Desulfobacterales bacterium]|nr:AMP-binding protein [Desulfobacterales bacterium]